jgi:hypothetical protein
MRSRAHDSFEEWLATPIPSQCADPRFEVRRAELSDFERIYDTVDDAFGVKRPRAAYDWLYRESPLGPARCWLLLERATGEVVNVAGRVGWPLAHGREPVEGAILADNATLRRYQRQGIGELRRQAREADPWRQRSLVISWPNEKSRARSAKLGRAHRDWGPLPRWLLPLRTSSHLQLRYGLPKPLAGAVGAAADLSLSLGRTFSRQGRSVHVEELSAFDESFDAITWAGMTAPEFWSPHDADFLNWRYMAHPAQEYVCLAASEGDASCGYTVVRLAPGRAVLMELVFPPDAQHVAHALIRRAAAIAREAGCPHLDWESTPSWPHEAVLLRAGFRSAPSNLYVNAYRHRKHRFKSRLDQWRLVPGDQDAL